MSEPEIDLEIVTDWKVGNPIVNRGFHHIRFENRGRILQFEPNKFLRYNFLSSLSWLPDKPENQTIVEFRLVPLESQTSLTLTLFSFPTEAIFKHLEFYWRITIKNNEKVIEKKHGWTHKLEFGTNMPTSLSAVCIHSELYERLKTNGEKGNL